MNVGRVSKTAQRAMGGPADWLGFETGQDSRSSPTRQTRQPGLGFHMFGSGNMGNSRSGQSSAQGKMCRYFEAVKMGGLSKNARR